MIHSESVTYDRIYNARAKSLLRACHIDESDIISELTSIRPGWHSRTKYKRWMRSPDNLTRVRHRQRFCTMSETDYEDLKLALKRLGCTV